MVLLKNWNVRMVFVYYMHYWFYHQVSKCVTIYDRLNSGSGILKKWSFCKVIILKYSAGWRLLCRKKNAASQPGAAGIRQWHWFAVAARRAYLARPSSLLDEVFENVGKSRSQKYRDRLLQARWFSRAWSNDTMSVSSKKKRVKWCWFTCIDTVC